MLVKELIEKLQQMPQNLPVMITSDSCIDIPDDPELGWWNEEHNEFLEDQDGAIGLTRIVALYVDL